MDEVYKISLVRLVLLTKAHKEQVYGIFLSAFLPQSPSTYDNLTEYFKRKISPRLERDDPIYVAYVGNTMVGFAMFEKWAERSYYLAEMAVSPEYQRRGIGKQLVFSILSEERAVEKILLITRNNNRVAQSFYEKVGFKPSSFQHPEYPENFIGYEYIGSVSPS